jgi:hypothetical protein
MAFSFHPGFPRNFHFGLPNLIQYKPKRDPLVLRAAFFFPEPFPTMQDGALALLAKPKIANYRLFNTFHKHPSVPHVLLCPVSLYHRPPRYPVATARAPIRRTMLPNNRRVRWLSASISQ